MIIRYDGCNTGDVAAMTACFTDDVVHYFLAPNPGSAPVAGAEHLARYWRSVQRRIAGRWVVDNLLAADDQAVIEWTLFWTPEPGAERVATRGSEWFRFRDGRIVEIRAYYQQHPQATTELDGFDYRQRGYSTPATERSRLHRAHSPGGTAAAE